MSGSVAGKAANRSENSLKLIQDELRKYLNQHLNNNDTIILQSFTDRYLESITITNEECNSDDFINSLGYPRKGNSNIAASITLVDKFFKTDDQSSIVLITDGLHNEGVSNSELLSQLSDLSKRRPGKTFMFLLSEKDKQNSVVQAFEQLDGLCLVNSLSEIDYYLLKNNSQDIKKNVIVQQNQQTDFSSKDENESEFLSFNWKYLWLFLILILCCLSIIVIFRLLSYLNNIIISKTKYSASSVQKTVSWILGRKKWQYNILYKIATKRMKLFWDNCIPKYDNIKRGKVIANNAEQKSLLEEYKKETGKDLRYKNGEPDFSKVSIAVKLTGGLDSVMKGKDPRSNVHKAQDSAGEKLIKSKKGKVIANYVNKKRKDLTMDDYYAWKDNRLNKLGHEARTPHETLDGKEIQYPPTKYHKAFPHTGGVSMNKSIRDYFPCN